MLSTVRFAARRLWRSPALSLALLFTFAVGIGSSAVVLGFARGLALRDLPNADRLVRVSRRTPREAAAPLSVSDLTRLAERRLPFTSVSAAIERRLTVNAAGVENWSTVAYTSHDLFATLGIAPALGVLPAPRETAGKTAPIQVLISDALWKHAFGAEPRVTALTFELDDRPATVAGVVPEWFTGLSADRPIDVWIPLSSEALAREAGPGPVLSVVARLRSPNDLPAAQSAATSIFTNGDVVVAPYSLVDPDDAIGVAKLERVVLGSVALLMLIAGANVVGLSISRVTESGPALAVRVSLGASRGQLLGLVLSETIVSVVIGVALAGVVALWTTGVIPSRLFEEDAEHLRMNVSGWALAIAAIVMAALSAIGPIAAAMSARRKSPMPVLARHVAHSSGGPRAARFRAWLLIGQVALCCALVASAGAVIDLVHRALRTDAGARVSNVAIARVTARQGYGNDVAGARFFEQVEQQARQQPHVAAAGRIQQLPGAVANSAEFTIERRPASTRTVELDADEFNPALRKADALRPIAGRMFGGLDSAWSCKTAIVNDRAARDVFAGDALGRTVADAYGQTYQIVGVMPDTPRSGEVRPTIESYAPQQSSWPVMPEATAFRVGTANVARERATINVNVATPSAFALLGISVEQGRLFAAAADACGEAVVNDLANNALFDGQAIGGAVVDAAGRRFTIVGVVNSPVYRVMQRAPEPVVYLSSTQQFTAQTTLVVSTTDTTPKALEAMAVSLARADGGSVGAIDRLDDYLGRRSLASDRIASLLVATSAVLGVFLCLLATAALVSDAARRRTPELALRLALGSTTRHILALLAWDAVRPAATGAVAGAIVSTAIVFWLSPSVSLWITGALLLVCPALLVAIIALAATLPAQQALTIRPATLLR